MVNAIVNTVQIHIIEEEGPSCSLFLNRAMSLLYIPGSEDIASQPFAFWHTHHSGWVYPSWVPCWPSLFCNLVLMKRVEKVKESLRRLPDLWDSQMETTLLRHCLSLPKFASFLRTCPPHYIMEAAATFWWPFEGCPVWCGWSVVPFLTGVA